MQFAWDKLSKAKRRQLVGATFWINKSWLEFDENDREAIVDAVAHETEGALFHSEHEAQQLINLKAALYRDLRRYSIEPRKNSDVLRRSPTFFDKRYK